MFVNSALADTPGTEGSTGPVAQLDGPRSRRRRPPPKHRRPRQSEAMRRRWADPEYRAKQEKHFAARRADPAKAWSRKGIGDGYTRETAAAAWAEAERKAQTAMDALKRAGLV